MAGYRGNGIQDIGNTANTRWRRFIFYMKRKYYHSVVLVAVCISAVLLGSCAFNPAEIPFSEPSEQTYYTDVVSPDRFPEPAGNAEQKYRGTDQIPETTEVPDICLLEVYEDFGEAGEKLQTDILDFGVRAKVRMCKIYDSCVLQANIFLANEEDWNSTGGLVKTFIEGGDGNSVQSRKENPNEAIRPVGQYVLLNPDEERTALFTEYETAEISQKSYFSENLQSDIHLYFGKYAESDNTTAMIASAVTEYDGAVYKLNFEIRDFKSMEDFETNAKKII